MNSGEVCRVTCRFMLAGVITMENVFQFRMDEVLPVNDTTVIADLAVLLDDAYQGLVANMSNQVTGVDITFHNITTNSPMGVAAWPTFTTGSASDNVLPPGVAALISFGTGVIKVIGKKYLPVFTEASQSGGGLVGTAVTDVATWAGTFLGNILAGGHNYKAGVIAKSGGFKPFISFRNTSYLGYQRRRKLGRGI